MKIAYLTGEYPRATDTFIQREVQALRGLGYRIETCSMRRTDSVHHVGEEQRREAAQTFHVLEAAKNPLRLLMAHAVLLIGRPKSYLGALKLALATGSPGFKGRFYQLIYFAEAGVLARHLRHLGIEHLHNHIAKSSASVAMIASRLSGIPFSFTLHGPDIFFEAERWRLDAKISAAAFVACISHYCRSQAMISADPGDWGKLHLIHCGVDPGLYRKGDAQGVPRLLFVGRLAAVKGVPLLLEAVARLVETGTDVALDLVGDGPDRAVLEAMVSRLNLSDRVVFHGYRNQDEVAGFLENAAAFVLPSFAEGLPVVLMEALASECPAIATRIAGIPELIRADETGRIVDPGDVAALVTAIGECLGDPETSALMARAGRDLVAKEFDSRLEAQRLSGLIESYARDQDPPAIRPEAMS